MLVSEVAGRTLHQHGVEVVFGLMGSGNLAVTNALVAAGARFFSSRHESGESSTISPPSCSIRRRGRSSIVPSHGAA